MPGLGLGLAESEVPGREEEAERVSLLPGALFGLGPEGGGCSLEVGRYGCCFLLEIGSGEAEVEMDVVSLLRLKAFCASILPGALLGLGAEGGGGSLEVG